MQGVLRAGSAPRLVRRGVPRPLIFAVFLMAIFAASAFSQAQILFLSRTASTIGAPGFTLVVQTNEFGSDTTPQVFFDTTPLATSNPTTDPTIFQAIVPANLLTALGTFPVTMHTDVGASNAINYSVLPAPVITSFIPVSFTATNPGPFLRILGANFVTNGSINDTVMWDTTPFFSVSVQTGEISSGVPLSVFTVGTHTITIVTDDGVTSNARQITVNPAPTLTSLSQNVSTATAPTFTLRLNGTNFVTGMTVFWNVGESSTALTMTGLTPTQISATVPAALVAAPGIAALNIVAPDGVSTEGQAYTIVPVPVISSVTPNTITAGHAQFLLDVSGSQIPPNSIVRWNGANRPTVTVNSGTQQATIPASDVAAAGTATVTLVSFDGVSSNGLPFTITAGPAIIGFSPASRSAGQGQFTLTINGANFVAGDTVTWNGGGLAITSLTANQIQVTIPAALTQNPGTAQIAVISPDGAPSGNSPYSVGTVPTLTSISPASHTATFGTFTLTLNGANFASGMTVNWLNGSTNTQLAIASLTATQITATVPAALISASGLATVTVATADGAASGGATFTINRVPAITSLNPASHTAGAAAFTLTVNGTDFVNGVTTVNWKGSPRATTFVSATQLTAAISAADVAAAGTATVTLINVDGVSSNGLPFTISGTPAITSFSPASRSAGQGQFTLTINGANFAAGDTVTWNGGGLAITSLTANQIQVTIPAALTQNPGTAQIAVISPDGASSGNSPYRRWYRSHPHQHQPGLPHRHIWNLHPDPQRSQFR